MEAYTKKLDTLEVKMLVTTDTIGEKTSWDINVYNDKKDNLLIDHFEMPITYNEKQADRHGDFRKHVIIGDVVIKDRTIYLMLYKNNYIYLKTYYITKDNKIIKNKYIAGYTFCGSYLNFGDPNYSAEIKIIDHDKLFIKSLGGSAGSFGYFPLLKFDISKKQITKIIFDEKPRKKRKDKNQLFGTMDLDKDQEKVIIEIKKIVKNKNLQYLGSIDQTAFKVRGRRKNSGSIYFLYKKNKQKEKIKIIRYNCYEDEWLIDRFKEENVNPKITE